MKLHVRKQRKCRDNKWMAVLVIGPTYTHDNIIYIGYYDSQPEAFKAGQIAYRFATMKVSI